MSYELRRRIAVTVVSLVAARLLLHVPVPFVDVDQWHALMGSGVDVGYFPTAMRRGALGGLWLWPYFAASVMTSLVLALRQRGPATSGPREVDVVLLALAIAMVQGFAYAIFLEQAGVSAGLRGLALQPGVLFRVSTVVSLTAGVMVLIGLARLITSRGIGNGVVLILALDLLTAATNDVIVGADASRATLTRGGMTVAVLIPVAWIVIAVALLWARWDVGGLIRGRPDGERRLALQVAGVGIVGISLADKARALPTTVAGFLPPGSDAGGLLDSFARLGLLHALVFVAVSFVFTAMFAAWAYDARGLEHTLVRGQGPPPSGTAWLDEAGYQSRLERIALPLALAAPVALVLFRTIADALSFAIPEPLTLIVLAAIVMDTERQWRLHHRMAMSHAPAAGESADAVRCLTCGAWLDGGRDFCPACGTELLEGATCVAHPDEASEARCVVCRRRLCANCRRSSEGRSVCAAHSAIVLVEGWARVSAPETPVEAELLRLRLASRGLETFVLANTVAPWYGTHGLYEINRLIPFVMHPEIGGGGIQLVVRPESWEQAGEILSAPASAGAAD